MRVEKAWVQPYVTIRVEQAWVQPYVTILVEQAWVQPLYVELAWVHLTLYLLNKHGCNLT